MARKPKLKSEPVGFIGFEINLMKAVLDQITLALADMEGAPLTIENVATLPNRQGVYQLVHQGVVKYVGKTDADAGLNSRLRGHVKKFQQRQRIKPEDVYYRAAQIYVLTAVDIETDLIKKYRAEWNGSSFGSNDPGRRREETNKPVDGFDMQFPIDIDLSGTLVKSGAQTVHAVLVSLKRNLPYCFRYETADEKPNAQSYLKRPHPDQLISNILIADHAMTVRDLLKLIVAALPPGWQATKFASHVILYKETRAYVHGMLI